MGFNTQFKSQFKSQFKEAFKGVSIPDGALAFYNFAISTLEQVRKQAELLTLRASNSNPEQLDGSVTTVGTNTAALVIGDGDLIQGEATDNINNPSFDNSGDNTTPNLWTNVNTGSPTWTFSDKGNYSKMSMSVAIGERVRFRATSMPYTDGELSILSIFVESPINCSPSDILRRDSMSVSSALYFYNNISINSTDPLVGSGRLELRLLPSATGTNAILTVGLSVGGTSPDIKSATIYIPNWVEEDFVSSPILGDDAGPHTRAADNSSIVTYLKEGVLNDAGEQNAVTLGDFNASGYVGGVRVSDKKMTFDGGGVNDGKYKDHLTSDFIGAIYISRVNGARALFTSNANSQTSFYEPLDGATEAEILAGFSWPAEFILDATRSLYAPSNVAGWITARTSAGDTGLVDDTEQWPVNDFEIDFTAEFLDNPATAIIFENKLIGGIDRISILRESGAFRFARARLGGVTAEVATTSAISDVSNRKFNFKVTQSSTTGITIEVNEIGGSYTSTDNLQNLETIKDINPWQNTATLAARNGGLFPINTLLSTITIKSL